MNLKCKSAGVPFLLRVFGVFYVVSCKTYREKEAIQEISRFFLASCIPGVLLCFGDVQLVLRYKGCCSGDWKKK